VVGFGSAAPVRLIELQAYGLHRMSISAAKTRERLLWRMIAFDRPSSYGRCTLRPVIGVPILWPIG